MTSFTIDCTGDVVTGDTIRFSEAVFGGSYRNPVFLGERTIEAEVIRDSYGSDRQQHTFTLRVLASTGVEPIAAGTAVRRKGRNVYRSGTARISWADETARHAATDERHNRGDAARDARAARKSEDSPWR